MATSIASPTELQAEEVQQILNAQKAYFRTGETLSLSFRKKQLKKLKKSIEAHEQDLLDALHKDFKKSAFEAYATEVGFSLEELNHVYTNIEKWAEPEKLSTSLINFPSSDFIYPEPYGVNLIIAPWNYPVQLTLVPLIGAIAAGNCAVIKPSELTRHTSALLQEMMEELYDPAYVKVVQGGVPTSTALLAAKWDHIFFTGSIPVGKIVMRAAAEYLTPITLELGGKSPCIVDETVNAELAARRIAWGKYLNGGQTCIAPDYILVHKSKKDELIEGFKKAISNFYGADPQQSPDFPRIINERNFNRLTGLMGEGEILIGGQTDVDDLYIAPTVLSGVSWDDPVMKDEIFGPILPVLEYEDLEEAIAAINDRPKPLALYLFSNRSTRLKKVLKETSSGGVCVNDTLTQMVNPQLPFGGVGPSGIGTYHGKFSFDTFSHKKSVSKKGNWLDIPLRYAPYKGKLEWVKRAFKWS